ncbi:MAG: DUF3352 domain-containing protein [Candidatus Gracilibacteria bacterium]
MSFPRRLFREVILFSGFFCVSIFFTACQQASGLDSAFRTPSGLQAESFLPERLLMLATLGSGDVQQNEQFMKLLDHFPLKDREEFGKNVLDGLNNDLHAVDLDYQRDLEPVLGQNFQGMMAFARLESSEKPDVYAFVTLKDPEGLDRIFQSLETAKKLQKLMHGEYAVYSTENQAQYMVRVQDLLVVANRQDLLESALDRWRLHQPSLLNYQPYRRALAQLKPAVAFGYIDFQGLFTTLRQSPDSKERFEKLLGFSGSQMLDIIEGEMFYLRAEEKGLRFYGSVYGQEEKMKALEQNFLTYQTREPYLVKKIPGSRVFMYFEGYNLASVLSYDFEIWSQIEGFSAGLEKMRQTFSSVGLDFDRDFLPLFEKGVAFKINNESTILPTTGIFVDVSGHEESAGKVMRVLKNMGDALLKNAPVLQDSPGFITNEEVQVGGGQAYVARIHMNKLGPSQKNLAAAALLLTKPVELWYGVTGDNIAFLAFEPDFDKNYAEGPKVAQDEQYRAVVSNLSGLKGGINYVSPAVFTQFLDKIFDLGKLGGRPDERVLADYESIKSYLKPLKGFAFTTLPVSAGETHFEGFGLIE